MIIHNPSSNVYHGSQQLLTKRTRILETRGFAQPAPPSAGLVSLWRRLCRSVLNLARICQASYVSMNTQEKIKIIYN